MRRYWSSRRVCRLRRLYRRLRSPEASPTTLPREMAEGAGVGFIAAVILTVLLVTGVPSEAQLLFFSSLGLLAGGVLGAVLWIGSASWPEETIAAPAPGQARFRSRRR